jgi:hypothetical protein
VRRFVSCRLAMKARRLREMCAEPPYGVRTIGIIGKVCPERQELPPIGERFAILGR